MRPSHKHHWEVVVLDAVARYEKQKGQGIKSIIYAHGRIEKCTCKSWRIVPNELGYRPVEIEASA